MSLFRTPNAHAGALEHSSCLQSAAASPMLSFRGSPVQSWSRIWHCKFFCNRTSGVLHAGDGVLKEFGFNPGRFFLDACAVWLLAAAFAALTYYSLATAGLGSHSSLMLWWRQWLGQVHDNGLSGRRLIKMAATACGGACTVPLSCVVQSHSKVLVQCWGRFSSAGPRREVSDQACWCCYCVCGRSHTGSAIS